MHAPPLLGIDLGTTNTTAAILDGGAAQVVVRAMPSMVGYRGPEVHVGSEARRLAVANPRGTIRGAKRLLGRRFDDPEVQRIASTLPYALAAAPNGDVWIDVEGRPHSPQEVAALLLRDVKRAAA